MRLENIFKKEYVDFNFHAEDKETAIKKIAQIIAKKTKVDEQVLLKSLKEREKISTTGVGKGIAIPHAALTGIDEAMVFYLQSPSGVDFESMDDKVVHHFFCILVPEGNEDEHLSILAELSKRLVHQETIDKLKKVKDFSDLMDALETKGHQEEKHGHYEILAVTACATGIAHTYMAQEKLEMTAQALGKTIKVETNGSSGVQNRLSQDEIEKADAIIIAADIKVEMERFSGKRLIHVPVAKAIHEPEKLIKDAEKANIFQVETSSKDQASPLEQGLYGHLMSGISYMLPFVVGGGILIALSFLFDQLLGIPESELANLGSHNPFAASLNQIGGMAFSFMLPVLAGYIAYGIADRPGLVLGFVAGGLANAGGAGFLGALIGGFLAGSVMNFVKKSLASMPNSFDGIKTILLYPVLGLLIIGFLMFLLNVPMKWINDGLNQFLANLSGTNAVLLGLLLGAMMALDLGGPVNKAAYVFATGTLASSAGQGSSIMAAVMAAGMVPPLAVFIASKIRPQLFTEEERQAGNTNLVLGLSFITEGAIPFASQDPVRVIPSYVIGSALSGALVMLSQITVNAPHGGIFVIFLVSKPLLYLLYIALGSFISSILLLSFFKKSK